MDGVQREAAERARQDADRADRSLVELVDLTVQRARRTVRFAWAQYLTTAACVGCVLFMYFSEAVFHRLALGRVRRFSDLRREISPPEGADAAK